MADYNNIPVGLNITTQIPLDVKTISLTEASLASLGTNNNKAFTYYDGLRVYCLDTRKIYEWREREVGDGDGLLSTDDFTYPNNIVAFGITYSNKIFNFFEIQYAYSSDVKEIVSPNNTVNITETSTQIQLTVTPPDGSETKINEGTNITILGSGTTVDPYEITSNITGLVTVGSGISITGLGTIVSPYVLTANVNNGWLSGDTKEIVCDATYVSNNFETSGLGKNERLGWAIMNGNNGTPNDNGRVVVAYGTSYPTLGAIGGEETHVLTKDEIPPLNLTIVPSGDDSTEVSPDYFLMSQRDPLTEETLINVVNKTSLSESHNNMQPYVVRLRIIKL